MKKRGLRIILSCLMLIAVLMTSCSKTAQTTATTTLTATATTTTTTTTSAPTPTTTTASNTPQYGGTYIMTLGWGGGGPANWDAQSVAGLTANTWVAPCLDYILIGDIEKYGPRGTNEFPFTTAEFVPTKYLGIGLAESYEWTDSLTLTFHIRKGVYFTGNARIGMASREFTAADAAISLKRWLTIASSLLTYMDSITATDKYTLVFHFNKYVPGVWFRLVYGMTACVYAPETIQAGPADWKNLCGTGPFILSDYVPGTGATYLRNPNYWRTSTINGVEYQLPFIDRLRYAIIPDDSTKLAALRTAKVDQCVAISQQYESSLTKSSPDMIKKQYLMAQTHVWVFKCYTGILKDVNVRRALMIGTNLVEIRDKLLPGGLLHCWPISSSNPALYTPMEELPASAKELYEYNPAKAIQMLKDAGYPNGFTLKMSADPSSFIADEISLVQNQWAKINVKLEATVLQPGVLWTKMFTFDYPDIAMTFMNNVDPTNVMSGLYTTKGYGYYNFAGWSDAYFDTQYYKAEGSQDPNVYNPIFKELAVYALESVAYLPQANPLLLNCYWPWAKNYYGEIESGLYNFMGFICPMWIDQGMKKSMGY